MFQYHQDLTEPDQPRIILSYNSEQLRTIIGKSSFAANTISVDTDILNDNTQKDIFLQWLVKGFIEMRSWYCEHSRTFSPD